MSDPPIVYADDPDAHVDCRIDDANDWADPTVAVAGGAYEIAATWLGDPGSQRWLRIPLTGLAVRTAGYNLYLRVPGGSDIYLGTVYVRERS